MTTRMQVHYRGGFDPAPGRTDTGIIRTNPVTGQEEFTPSYGMGKYAHNHGKHWTVTETVCERCGEYCVGANCPSCEMTAR